MAETVNTSVIADLVFNELFSVLGWKVHGPKNTSWDCTKRHKYNPPLHGKHSTDAVFYYDDPYLASRIFVNLDFKSYAKSSLETIDITANAQRLANTVECANRSLDFQSKFHTPDESGQTVGMLFIHNHDNDYDASKFRSVMRRLPPDSIDIQRGRRLAIVGPDAIDYIASVVNDIQVTRSKLPTHKSSFYYPHLVQRKAVNDVAVSIESLLGPWQIVRYDGVLEGRPDTQYHMYIRSSGATSIEFEYLIDFMFTYQLLDRMSKVVLKLTNASQDASIKLDNAKTMCVGRYNGLAELHARLTQVSFQRVHKITMKYSEYDIGMRRD